MWEYQIYEEMLHNQILFRQSFNDSNVEWWCTLTINNDGNNTYILEKWLYDDFYDKIEIRIINRYNGLLSNFKDDIIKISKLLDNNILPSKSLNLKKKISDYVNDTSINLNFIVEEG